MTSKHCPYCHTPLIPSDTVLCLKCRAGHHSECIAIHGECVVYGCDGRAVLVGDKRLHVDELAQAHGLTISEFQLNDGRKDLEPFYLRLGPLTHNGAYQKNVPKIRIQLLDKGVKRGQRVRGKLLFNVNKDSCLETVDFELLTELTTTLPDRLGRKGKERKNRLVSRQTKALQHSLQKQNYFNRMLKKFGGQVKPNLKAGQSELSFSLSFDKAFPKSLEHQQGGEADKVETRILISAKFDRHKVEIAEIIQVK